MVSSLVIRRVQSTPAVLLLLGVGKNDFHLLSSSFEGQVKILSKISGVSGMMNRTDSIGRQPVAKMDFGEDVYRIVCISVAEHLPTTDVFVEGNT